MEQASELNTLSALPEQENSREGRPISGPDQELPARNVAVVIFCISYITFISSYLGGLVIVAVPQIASDLHLSPGMELWPVSMYALGTGCTLLVSGAISDMVGTKPTLLMGCILQSVFSMAAMCLNPIAADVLFTVATIVIAGMFSTETQSLAADVFNTVSHFCRSIGLALASLIANSVTEKDSP